MKNTMLLVATLTAMILTGCSNGLDNHPDLTNVDTYKARIEADVKGASPTEIAAYNFAVSDLNFDKLKANYGHESYRGIAKHELAAYQSKLEVRLDEVEKLKPELEKRSAEIAKIKVTVKSAEVTHDTFFNKWDVAYHFTIANGSGVPLSKLRLKGTLSIDGKPDVLYEFAPSVNFENGLNVGQIAEKNESMVGFLSFEKPITLEVRNSKSIEIKLVAKDGADYSEHWIVGNDFMQELSGLPGRIAEVKKYLSQI